MMLTLTMMRSLGPLAHALRDAAMRGMRRVGNVLEARRNRRAVIRLCDCDDRMLKDIGLCPSEVVGALAVGYAEDPSALLRRSAASHAVLDIERSPPSPCPHSPR